MIKFLSSTIGGTNNYKILCFWTGIDKGEQTGSNGKSTVCTSMKYTLGDYYVKGSPSMIISNCEKAECAYPALA